MRVAFIQNLWEDFQGPLILTELLEREGHEVRFFLEERGWFQRLAAWEPEVVAASAITGNHLWILKAAEKIKTTLSPPPFVVMGGAHPTFFTSVIEHPAVDAICRGEGEVAFPRLLAETKGKRLPENIENFWVKRNGQIHKNDLGPLIKNLDDNPIPRRSLYADHPFLKNAPCKRTVTSRGCPFNCTYCFNHVYRTLMQGKGAYLRRRSVGHVLEELAYLKSRFGLRMVEFTDDVFTSEKEWFLEFASEYKRRINRPYWMLIHVTHIDEEIADTIKASGCTRVTFSIESGSERIRRDLMNKALKNDDILNCARLLRERDIPFQTFNMVGFPGETTEEAFETIRINKEIKPFYAWCSIVQPYPGTKLSKMCEEMGLLEHRSGRPEEIGTSWFHTSVILQKNRKALSNLQKFFGLLVKYPWIEPLIRVLIKFPPNGLFKYMHQFYYGYHMKNRNHLPFFFALRLYARYRKYY